MEGCVHIGDPWPVACHRDQCWILSCVSSINDLDEYPIQFPNDTKIGDIVDSEENCKVTDLLGKQSMKGLVQFNSDKYKEKHFGKLKQARNTQSIAGLYRVLLNNKNAFWKPYSTLKVTTQVDRVVKKAYIMVAVIGHDIK